METIYLLRIRYPSLVTTVPTAVGLVLASLSFLSDSLSAPSKTAAILFGMLTVVGYLWLSSITPEQAADQIAANLLRRDPYLQDLLTSAGDELLWEHLRDKHPPLAVPTVVEALRRQDSPSQLPRLRT
jgi:hypothetical protein